MDNYVFLIGRINKFAKISGIRVSLIDIEDFLSNLGFNCAVCSDDIFLKIYIEIEEENKIDIVKLKKEISNKMNISSNSIKFKTLSKLIGIALATLGTSGYQWVPVQWVPVGTRSTKEDQDQIRGATYISYVVIKTHRNCSCHSIFEQSAQ